MCGLSGDTVAMRSTGAAAGMEDPATPLLWGQTETTTSPRQMGHPESFESGFQGLWPADFCPMDLRFENLGLRLRGGRGPVVLQGVTGEIRHGRMTAVMGPSGSGKTTFLTALLGRAHYGRITGKVLINGVEGSLAKFQRLVGFVPQEDVMCRVLTVRENLMHSAALRLPASMSWEDKVQMVTTVVELLQLTEVQHSAIGDEETRGVSGGQRKRCNIGIELVAAPCAIFLDEPTSGLDSSSSMEVCKGLSNIAHSLGVLLAAVIHQPRYEIFELFDDVLLLAPGGRTVYMGPTSEVASYFGNLGFICPVHTNPSDFFLDVISGEAPACATPGALARDLPSIWGNRSVPGDDSLASEGSLDRSGAASPTDSMASGPPAHAELQGGCCSGEGLFMHIVTRPRMGWAYAVGALTGPFGLLYYDARGERAEYGEQAAVVAGALFLMKVVPVAAVVLMFATISDPRSAAYTAAYLTDDALTAAMYIGIWGGIFALGFLATARLVRRYKHGGPLRHVCRALIAFMLPGPVGVLVVFAKRTSSSKDRLSALMAYGMQCFLLGLFMLVAWGVWWLRHRDLPAVTAVPVMVGVGLGLIYLEVIMAVVFHHRYRRLPTRDRTVASPLVQTWRYFQRGILIHMRNWKAALGDLLLQALSGSFLGLIYHDQSYIGGLYEPAYMACTTAAEAAGGSWSDICKLARDDPIIGEASLCILALSLGALVSSLRIFGRDKVVFTREAYAGASTEANWIGSGLAHLPLILLCPLAFLLPYHALSGARAPFMQYYHILTLVYFFIAGVSYLCSILLSEVTAQLVAILCVLIMFCFSGANPTLSMLEDPKRLWGLLQYPTFEDKRLCWIMMIVITVVVRTLGYTALVKREP